MAYAPRFVGHHSAVVLVKSALNPSLVGTKAARHRIAWHRLAGRVARPDSGLEQARRPYVGQQVHGGGRMEKTRQGESIPIVEEELRVEKRQSVTGRVRVRTEV